MSVGSTVGSRRASAVAGVVLVVGATLAAVVGVSTVTVVSTPDSVTAEPANEAANTTASGPETDRSRRGWLGWPLVLVVTAALLGGPVHASRCGIFSGGFDRPDK